MHLTSYNFISQAITAELIPPGLQLKGQLKREMVSGYLELSLLISLNRGCLLNSRVKDLWEKRTPSSCFSSPVFPSKPGLLLLVLKLIQLWCLPQLVQEQHSHGLPVRLVKLCPFIANFLFSTMFADTCLASVYMGSSYEIVTVCVDFDMVSLQDNAS